MWFHHNELWAPGFNKVGEKEVVIKKYEMPETYFIQNSITLFCP